MKKLSAVGKIEMKNDRTYNILTVYGISEFNGLQFDLIKHAVIFM